MIFFEYPIHAHVAIITFSVVLDSWPVTMSSTPILRSIITKSGLDREEAAYNSMGDGG